MSASPVWRRAACNKCGKQLKSRRLSQRFGAQRTIEWNVREPRVAASGLQQVRKTIEVEKTLPAVWSAADHRVECPRAPCGGERPAASAENNSSREDSRSGLERSGPSSGMSASPVWRRAACNKCGKQFKS